MKNVLLAALLVSAAALAARESSAAGEEPEPEQDESDSAPFMIVVEHTNGRRCGGSLVSLHAALTSARCARGAARRLRVRAPGAGAARRVARVLRPAGAAADLAVLELQAPFGGDGRARPIVVGECEPRAACQLVRALGAAPRLRIVDAALVPGRACAARSASELCLVGPTLCSRDWGAGVVCEGKLCGVLSRSTRSEASGAGEVGEAGEPREELCGDTHVAQNVALWRRFLHCANTLRACGRGGTVDCAQLCSEQRLLEADDTDSATRLQSDSTEASSADPVEINAVTDTPTLSRTFMLPITHAQSSPRPVPSVTPPTRSSAPAPQRSTRPSFEFEPNRPDFKAGEYGDNAAEYGDEEPAAAAAQPASPGRAAPAPPAAPAPAPAPPAPASTLRPSSLQARVSLAARASRASPCTTRPASDILYVLVAITILAN